MYYLPEETKEAQEYVETHFAKYLQNSLQLNFFYENANYRISYITRLLYTRIKYRYNNHTRILTGNKQFTVNVH